VGLVNPKDEVDAVVTEISMGLTTISEALRRRGMKPDLVFTEAKSDFDRLRGDGTLDVMLALLARKQLRPDEPPADAGAAV
jgi:capsid protein